MSDEKCELWKVALEVIRVSSESRGWTVLCDSASIPGAVIVATAEADALALEVYRCEALTAWTEELFALAESQEEDECREQVKTIARVVVVKVRRGEPLTWADHMALHELAFQLGHDLPEQQSEAA